MVRGLWHFSLWKFIKCINIDTMWDILGVEALKIMLLATI